MTVKYFLSLVSSYFNFYCIN